MKNKTLFKLAILLISLLCSNVVSASNEFVSCDLHFHPNENIYYEDNSGDKLYRWNTMGSMLFYTDPYSTFLGLDSGSNDFENFYVNRGGMEYTYEEIEYTGSIGGESGLHFQTNLDKADTDSTVLVANDKDLYSDRYVAYDGFQAGCSDDGWRNDLGNDLNQYEYFDDTGSPGNPAECGSEDGTTYAYDDTDWNTNNFCSVGDADPSQPDFPEQGDTTQWTCNEGGESVSCSVERNDKESACCEAGGEVPCKVCE